MNKPSDALNARALALFEKSLDIAAKDRKQWIIEQAGSDISLREKALSYLSRDASKSAAFHTGGAFHDTLDDTSIPDEIGAYKITGLIGRGGMGAVYRGERASGDFDHDVAIKVVRPGTMSDKLVDRFETERQTLAQLSHPHIARLYDGGTLENGAPYIVMEYIDGFPITEWADKENLSLDRRLALFQAACAAVSHAHQNLIIHRDITPSNVLVDASGLVKLIDFGIAKPLNEDAAVADMAHSLTSLSFTPGFAAPERSKGASANTLSDIYSLGKLLRAIISETNYLELNAIIIKATSLEPSDRYNSVDSLNDDIENYRNNYPVDALDGGRGYRTKKFIHRQRVGVSFTALALTGLVGGLIATTMLYKQAEVARQSANQRFSETRGLTSFLIDEVSSDLKGIPGTLPVIEKVNATSAKYLDILAAAAESDDGVMLDYALGLRQLGEVMTVAGGANLGNPEEGLKNFEKAIEVLRELETQQPDNWKVHYALANSLADYVYGRMYHQGNMEHAKEVFEESLHYFDKVIEKKPDFVPALIDKARTQVVQTNLRVFDDVDLPNNDSLRADFEYIVEKFPDNKRVIPHYISFLRNMAGTPSRRWEMRLWTPIKLEEKTLYTLAEKDFLDAIKLSEKALMTSPKSSEYQYQDIWNIEELTRLYTFDRAWDPTFETLIKRYSKISSLRNYSDISELLETDPDFKTRLTYARFLAPQLDRTDKLLNNLAPFEGQTFTHIEAVFYNLKARSLLESRLRLNLDKGEELSQKALSMAEAFHEAQPDFRNAVLEIATTLTEKTRIIMAYEILYDVSRQDEVCKNLTRAKSLWVEAEKRWGEIIDYRGNVRHTHILFETAGCL